MNPKPNLHKDRRSDRLRTLSCPSLRHGRPCRGSKNRGIGRGPGRSRVRTPLRLAATAITFAQDLSCRLAAKPQARE